MQAASSQNLYRERLWNYHHAAYGSQNRVLFGQLAANHLPDYAITIGRDPANNICLDDDMASRFHCKIYGSQTAGTAPNLFLSPVSGTEYLTTFINFFLDPYQEKS